MSLWGLSAACLAWKGWLLVSPLTSKVTCTKSELIGRSEMGWVSGLKMAALRLRVPVL